MGQPNYRNGFALTLHEHALDIPRRWASPKMVFVNSMSDLFHEKVPLEYIQRVFQVMAGTPRHTFQVLTKRAERLAELAPYLPWPPNVWMGTSIENARFLHRADSLRRVPANVRFLSCEPLLGSLAGLQLGGIHWVIVGGESGQSAREMRLEWVDEILQMGADENALREQRNALRNNVYVNPPKERLLALFVKQLGRVWARKTKAKDRGKGGDPLEWPPRFRVREFPGVSL
jgi:protein gp37